MTRTRIKICGVMSVETALAAANAGADAVGLMFVRESPRFIDASTAKAIRAAVPPLMTAVAVFSSNAMVDVAGTGGSVVQLHGDESDSYIAQLRGRWSGNIIRGFRFDMRAATRWNACSGVNALLIDGSGGGGGASFDHAALVDLMPSISKPVILAGGLTPETVGEAIRIVRPYAVDVSSGVESEPGVKDSDLIHAFCEAVRKADRTRASRNR